MMPMECLTELPIFFALVSIALFALLLVTL